MLDISQNKNGRTFLLRKILPLILMNYFIKLFSITLNNFFAN
uniref:Uncharacterized protein n=1 Tax=Podoviridae sp. ct8Lf7 TaxID=2827723 RepID=A0A8S5S178_9CAUD|nr:MAG TPA: hypothetical protein [Podoviridae sp. ct8Lf7]